MRERYALARRRRDRLFRRSVMLARVVSIEVRPEEMEECISIFKEVNAPSIAVRPGFSHGHWFVDRASGHATSVTFWENEEDEEASRANIPAWSRACPTC